MDYLIFRTDRIGDFLITMPLIKSLKRNNFESKISVVVSKKNEDFVKSNKLINNVILLESNTFLNKFKLYLRLRKISYDAIIVADKKNRSIIISLLLRSKNKIFNVSKHIQKKILSIFSKNVFLDNDNQLETPMEEIIKLNCNALKLDFKQEDFNFFPENYFKNSNDLTKDFIIKNNYIIFHYDEKWELENYSILFSKAKNLTSIKPTYKSLVKFLNNLAIKKNMKIIITTGFLKTDLVNKIKDNSQKKINSFYEVNKNINLITNQNFDSIAHLISKASLFISCHGALTHIASNYNINIIDIIEKEKINHYSRITKHMKEYKSIYRDNFEKMTKNIINS